MEYEFYQHNVYPDRTIPRVKVECSSDAECLLFQFENLWIKDALERLSKSFSENEDFSILVQPSPENPQAYVYVNKIVCEIDYEAEKYKNKNFTGKTLVQHKFTFSTIDKSCLTSKKSVIMKLAKFTEFDFFGTTVLIAVDMLTESMFMLVTLNEKSVKSLLLFLHDEQRLNPSPKHNKLYEKPVVDDCCFQTSLLKVPVLNNLFPFYKKPAGWKVTHINPRVFRHFPFLKKLTLKTDCETDCERSTLGGMNAWIFTDHIKRVEKKTRHFKNFIQIVIKNSFFKDLKTIILKEKEKHSLVEYPDNDGSPTVLHTIFPGLFNMTPNEFSDTQEQVSSLINALEKKYSNDSSTSSLLKTLKNEVGNIIRNTNHSSSELERKRELIVLLLTQNMDQNKKLKTEKIKSLESEASNSFRDNQIESLELQVEMERATSKALSNVVSMMKTEFVNNKRMLIKTHDAQIELRDTESKIIDEMIDSNFKRLKRIKKRKFMKEDEIHVDLTKSVLE